MPRSCNSPCSRKSCGPRRRATITACTGSFWSRMGSAATMWPGSSARTRAPSNAGCSGLKPGASPGCTRGTGVAGPGGSSQRSGTRSTRSCDAPHGSSATPRTSGTGSSSLIIWRRCMVPPWACASVNACSGSWSSGCGSHAR